MIQLTPNTHNNLNSRYDSITIPKRLLDKIQKLQDDYRKESQEEHKILREHLKQMSTLLRELNGYLSTSISVALTKKSIPFNTGSVSIESALTTKPENPDDYTVQVDVYAQNDNKVVEHMTIVNDGPGDLYFIVSYARDTFSTNELLLHPNDSRELFNVFEIRLRATLPLTSFRLVEGTFRTGSFAPDTKANVEIRPAIQPNEILKEVVALFDVNSPTITISSPTTQTLPTLNDIYPPFQLPLPPGETATFVDIVTGEPMPLTIPEGFIAEAFSLFDNVSTDHTVRNWLELVPGTFTAITVHPVQNRGNLLNLQLNLASQFSTEVVDPEGAPPGGRKTLFTVTNDDPFINMTGTIQAVFILRRLK